MHAALVFLLTASTLAGLLGGSFLTVLVTRGPYVFGLLEGPPPRGGWSLWGPRSRCPACLTPLPWTAVLPVIGYLLVRGRCRACGVSVPALYPLLEAAGAALGLLAGLAFVDDLPALVIGLFFLLGLLALGVIDARIGYLPDALTLPLIALGLGASAFGVFVSPLQALLGLSIGGGMMLALTGGYRLLRGREGLGGGDVKMVALGGAFLGPFGLPPALLIASLAALIGTLLSQRSRLRGDTAVKFGPYLALGIGAVFLLPSLMTHFAG
ncbi:hypothetical protein PB2503_08559 [Parvularcula bermudensis HTCC2503]|uniref:Prepilin leader peptidase/N-methyltransferase n=1 Tax=Parvularcula bermudensis (strain ATCC BAA-594 / HTCC2503 / KCTC 12087) TaxID=314260 RepID=E0TBP6_PARBH|nr:A24 family peptidase [Parvularcula bermudensis]ADM09767.1 hypothetical protein PB2503_08559 [Parvularcula bermudensis HTCC2503]